MAQSDQSGTASELGKKLAGKYLTFKLADEEYGLQILKVQEIIRMQTVTRVPRTPAYLRGVINLRGKVIPVIDLRRKFELSDIEDTERTSIIVVQVELPEGMVTMGKVPGVPKARPPQATPRLDARGALHAAGSMQF